MHGVFPVELNVPGAHSVSPAERGTVAAEAGPATNRAEAVDRAAAQHQPRQDRTETAKTCTHGFA